MAMVMGVSEVPSARTTTASRRVPFVLIVDDFLEARELFSENLRDAGFITETAEDGAQAIVKARSLQPDLIVMDMAMPVVDGWEAIRVLRADPSTRDIVIIAVAGKALPESGKSAYESGCDEYLTKPLSSDALARAVRLALASAVGKSYRKSSTPPPTVTGNAQAEGKTPPAAEQSSRRRR